MSPSSNAIADLQYVYVCLKLHGCLTCVCVSNGDFLLMSGKRFVGFYRAKNFAWMWMHMHVMLTYALFCRQLEYKSFTIYYTVWMVIRYTN